VELNAKPVKPAREVKPGDMLKVRTPGGDFEVEVLLLIQMRGPAPVAQTMYRETETSVEARRLKAEERKLGPDLDWIPEGRPNKKDRRAINRLRGR
jgi:ribosome-associated heat shock protein Hsp15